MNTGMNKGNKNGLYFADGDPGAMIYGNFINYYTFHSAEERISFLHPSMFPKPLTDDAIVCLDVGCNTGELTKNLLQYLQSVVYPKSEIKILGVDIDPILIQRAKEQNDHQNITYISLDITCSKEQNIIKEYLSSNNKQKFNIIFCFSVTMWIHINNGDEGLQEFLKYIKSHAMSVIIEPQPWKCYRNARRRVRRAGRDFPLYDSLKIRFDVNKVIEKFLLENEMEKMYESCWTSWDRRIQSYRFSD